MTVDVWPEFGPALRSQMMREKLREENVLGCMNGVFQVTKQASRQATNLSMFSSCQVHVSAPLRRPISYAVRLPSDHCSPRSPARLRKPTAPLRRKTASKLSVILVELRVVAKNEVNAYPRCETHFKVLHSSSCCVTWALLFDFVLGVCARRG